MSASPYEHERRFLVDLKDLPLEFTRFPMKYIVQGYLEDDLRTRLRDESSGAKHAYLQTRKSGSGVSRVENEVELSREVFEKMWSDVKCFLVKSRFFIPWDGVTIQLNLFHENLAGYIQIEVEFDSHDEAVAFIAPVWFGCEVTDEDRHGNYSLAKHGLPVY